MNGISSLNTSSLGGARVGLRVGEYSQGLAKRNKVIPVLWAGLGANLTFVSVTFQSYANQGNITKDVTKQMAQPCGLARLNMGWKIKLRVFQD